MAALGASKEKHDGLLRAWQVRRQAARRTEHAAARRARRVGRLCARHLAERYQVRKVYLFGSAASGDTFHSTSDIDLAVEGLPLELYFRAWTDLWALLPPGLELDLVPMECATADLIAHVQKESLLLYAESDLRGPTS